MKKTYNKYNLTYELIMAALALVVVFILFVEFTRPLTEEQATLLAGIDFAILGIFAVDYFYRLISAQERSTSEQVQGQAVAGVVLHGEN